MVNGLCPILTAHDERGGGRPRPERTCLNQHQIGIKSLLCCLPVLQPVESSDEDVEDLGAALGGQVVEVGEDAYKGRTKWNN